MDYKWAILAIGILLILILVYKKRHRIMSFFGFKNKVEPAIESPIAHYQEQPPPVIDVVVDSPKEEFVILTIASSPENGKEIEIGDLYIKLYDDICPRTCDNFRSLAKIEYKGCPFHRVIKGFMMQGGDFTNKNGTGGESIFGPKFPDENFVMKHRKRGMLSMANSGPDTNGSQFFITFDATPHLDGKHVVFGEVVKGFEVLDIVERMPTNGNDEPLQLVYIKTTGLADHY